MEVLKDYPKEFAELFRPSFNYLSKINMNFVAKEGLVKKYWRYSYVAFCLVMNYVTIGWKIANLAAEGEIFEITYALPPFLVFTQAILKAIVLIPKSTLLNDIIEELGALWRSTGLSETQSKVRTSLLKRMNFCNGMTYWLSIIGTTQYLMTPLVETLVRKHLLHQECDLLLPLECAYPFPINGRWAVYLPVYGFQIYSMCLCISVFIGTELFMITLCALLGVEFTLLCEDILRVKPSKQGGTSQAPSGDHGQEWTLKDIVQRHQKLCVLSKQLDEAFNKIIFINLLFVGVTTCFFRYAAQFSRGPTYLVNNYAALIASLLNILYLCYYGEVLAGASVRIGDMAYRGTWYEEDHHCKIIIFIIILRSQKPCCLTSLKYAPVSLNMFSKVMSSTWSYVSLMNQVYKEN